MQIHELNNFAGTPSSTDYLAIDNSTTTTKIGATGLGVQDQLTVAEANTGTSTASRIVTPKVVHDYVTGEVSDEIDDITTSTTKTKWSSITGNDGSINDALNFLADTTFPNYSSFTEIYNKTGIISEEFVTIQTNGWYLIDLLGAWNSTSIRIKGSTTNIAIAQIQTNNAYVNSIVVYPFRAGTELRVSIGAASGYAKISRIS